MQNAAAQDTDSGSEVFDIRTIISVVRINKWLFAGIFLAVFAVAMAVMLSAPSKYTSSTSVMIGGERLKVVPNAQEIAKDLPDDATQVDTEAEVLRSLALAEGVVDNLKLADDPEFNPALQKPSGLAALLPGNQSAAPISPDSLRQRVVMNVLNTVTVKRQGATRVVTVSVETNDPVKSARIANAWISQYMRRQSTQSNALVTNANEQIGSRLEELRQQALQADAAVQQFKIANGLGADTSPAGGSIQEQQIVYLSQQIGEARSALAASQARLSAAQRDTTGASGEEGASSEVLRDLRVRETEIRSRLASLRSRYGPMHPEVVKATNEEAVVNSQIAAERTRILSTLQTQVNADRQRLSSLEGSAGAARGSLNRNLSASTRLTDLQMQAQAAHSVYESYLQRYQDTSSQEGIENVNARVLSEAKMPTRRSSPKMGNSLLLAFFAGLFAASGAVAVKHSLRRGLTSGNDVIKHLNVPYLAGIADVGSTMKGRLNKKIKLWEYLENNPLSVFSEQYKILLNAVNFSKVSESKRVIAVTSAIPGEAKTTTSLCLAKTIEMLGKSVVVVDCDLRRHSVSTSIGGHYEAGLIEVLQNEVPLAKALYNAGRGVMYLPVTGRGVPQQQFFGTERMAALLEELKSHFDVVILDTAPVLPIVDTRLLAHQADVTVLLAKWNDTPIGATQTALDILYNEGLANLAGVALTMIDIKKQSISSGIGSEYYYNSYKSYYTTETKAS